MTKARQMRKKVGLGRCAKLVKSVSFLSHGIFEVCLNSD